MQNNIELEKLLGKMVRKGRNSGQPYTDVIALALWNCLRTPERDAVFSELERIRQRNDAFGQQLIQAMTCEST